MYEYIKTFHELLKKHNSQQPKFKPSFLKRKRVGNWEPDLRKTSQAIVTNSSGTSQKYKHTKFPSIELKLKLKPTGANKAVAANKITSTQNNLIRKFWAVVGKPGAESKSDTGSSADLQAPKKNDKSGSETVKLKKGVKEPSDQNLEETPHADIGSLNAVKKVDEKSEAGKRISTATAVLAATPNAKQLGPGFNVGELKDFPNLSPGIHPIEKTNKDGSKSLSNLTVPSDYEHIFHAPSTLDALDGVEVSYREDVKKQLAEKSTLPAQKSSTQTPQPQASPQAPAQGQQTPTTSQPQTPTTTQTQTQQQTQNNQSKEIASNNKKKDDLEKHSSKSDRKKKEIKK